MSKAKENRMFVAPSFELLDEARRARNLATVEDLFVELGKPFGITRSRAGNDYKAYRRLMTVSRLRDFKVPGYLAKGLKLGSSKKLSRDVDQHTRRAQTAHEVRAGT